MQNFTKCISVICASLLTISVSATAIPVTAEEAVFEINAAVQVKGVVLDSSGMPIIGATVMEVGSQNNGTLTGPDGSFAISVNKGASLRISYIGYKTVTVKANEGRQMSIVLEEDSELLNDVVVVARRSVSGQGGIGACLHGACTELARS